MDEFRRRLSDPELIELYDHWCALKGGRPMPSRKDLDPVHVPRHLASMMLIDVLRDPLRFRYRLVGTRVVEASGEDRTGRFFDEFEFFSVNPIVMEQYRTTVEMRQPLYSLEPFTNCIKQTSYEVERLLLPLATDGERVDMVLVYFHFKTGWF